MTDLVDARRTLTAAAADPGSARGAVHKVKIKVAASASESDLPALDGTAHGDLAVRLLLMEPAPADIVPGSWVDAAAVFLRVASAAPDRLVLFGRSARPGLAPRAAAPPDQEPPPPETKELPDAEALALFRNLASKFKDDPGSVGTPVDRESPDFLAAAQSLIASLSPEQVHRLAKNVPLRDLTTDPAKHRGDFVRVQGRLAYIYTHPISVTNPLQIREVFEGYIADLQGVMGKKVPVTFFMARKPEGEFHVQRNRRGEQYYADWVEVEGVFLRLYRYEGGVKGTEYQTPVNIAPVLLVRNLRILPPEKPSSSAGDFGLIVGVVGGLAAVAILVGGYMSRKYRSSRPMRMAMMKVRREKAATAGAPLFPKPKDPILGDEVKPPDAPAP